MTRIILVRHGQTEWNRVERFRGQIDLALNKVGQAQARKVATRLAEVPITAVYSSPLRRAMETAQPTAQKLGLPVIPLPGLMDINYGEWQGQTPGEVSQRYPDLYQQWLDAPHTVRFPQGESLEDVRLRAVAALQKVISQHHGPILLVAHQVVNKVLVCAMLGLETSHFWHITQDNGCINVFDFNDGAFTTVLVNDTCHVRQPA